MGGEQGALHRVRNLLDEELAHQQEEERRRNAAARSLPPVSDGELHRKVFDLLLDQEASQRKFFNSISGDLPSAQRQSLLNLMQKHQELLYHTMQFSKSVRVRTTKRKQALAALSVLWNNKHRHSKWKVLGILSGLADDLTGLLVDTALLNDLLDRMQALRTAIQEEDGKMLALQHKYSLWKKRWLRMAKIGGVVCAGVIVAFLCGYLAVPGALATETLCTFEGFCLATSGFCGTMSVAAGGASQYCKRMETDVDAIRQSLITFERKVREAQRATQRVELVRREGETATDNLVPSIPELFWFNWEEDHFGTWLQEAEVAVQKVEEAVADFESKTWCNEMMAVQAEERILRGPKWKGEEQTTLIEPQGKAWWRCFMR
eukprot:TRINITY_DN70564_c0_g1_i1.p1 TRINITY_DN70564_c0_g1~~TRINITY_DN70564_c0_g1_i1.p1  ORF type:complete len:376 (+),score=29.41 TRINITY_DN70564_c0_g1_i1:26-1153(+)